MNQYFLIRRLRGPAILLLIGVIALLHASGVIHSFWRLFWPLLLILLGVLLLAERTALGSEGGYPIWPFGGAANPGTGIGGSGQNQSTSIVPASTDDNFGKDRQGGQQ